MQPTGNSAAFRAELQELNERFENLKPEVELTVRDPELGVTGHLVVWSTLASRKGPLGACGKGGTRLTPTVDINELKMLSRIQTLKNAAAGLALGGAKSGLAADPNEPGFEKKYRRFVKLLQPMLRENGGPWGGFGYDLGGNPIHCKWACEELGSTKGFTGKPVELGGTDYDAEGIAGLGVAVAAQTLLEVKGEDPGAITCAVQGVGAMGAGVIRYFSETGAMITWISDPRIEGSWHLPEGLPVKLRDLLAKMDFAGALQELKAGGYTRHGLEDVLYQSVDVLFPCAVQEVLHKDNQARIQARYVVEGANNPLTAECRTALHDRGVLVVPDFIANAGGVIAAYVELISTVSDEENARTRAKVSESKTMTRTKIAENVRQMMDLVGRYGVEPVEAGRYIAFKRIFA
jgi:glutamate dehydrogenase (NAD(P)+)